MTRFSAMLICLAVAGCAGARTEDTKAADPGAAVTLAPGDAVSVMTTDMKVRFVAVTEDSRCPRDVNCIWAGEVKVLLEIRVSQAESQVEILEGKSTVAGGFRLTLVRVEPQRTSTGKIASQDYRATLKVDKAS